MCIQTLVKKTKKKPDLVPIVRGYMHEVQTLEKNDFVCIVDGYMHEVLLHPRVSCESSCVYPLPAGVGSATVCVRAFTSVSPGL